MKKSFITGFVSGAVIFGVVGALAASYTAVSNPFPIQFNGTDVNIEGYNINDSTYFKLRDIADVVGGFTVDFQDNTIQLYKGGVSVEELVISKFKEYFKLTDADMENTTITLNDLGNYYIVNAKQYTGDPDFPYDEWSCTVDKNTLEFSNFAN